MKPKYCIGVGWYSTDQWALLKILAEDADSLDDSYEDWMAGVQGTMEQLRKQKVEAVKVDVNVPTLQQWCREHGKPLNGSARAEYVAQRVQELARNKQQK